MPHYCHYRLEFLVESLSEFLVEFLLESLMEFLLPVLGHGLEILTGRAANCARPDIK